MKRGDIMPDEGAKVDDGWLIVDATPRAVIALDLCLFELYRWQMCEDGIRVAFRRSVRIVDDIGLDSDWVALAVTVFEAPPEIAAWLRGGR